MRSRAFRIALLAFQAIWLNAIVPGHTRGVVTLGGATCHTSTVAQHGCCPSKASSKQPAVPTKPSAQCAVCHFAARITPPPVIDLRPPPLALTSQRVEIIPRSADSADLPPAYYGRGPPVV
jgi:hypothetical protein